ncbi:MAG: hypothetical protein ACR2LK_06060, partial [Solirubrobacteraceae bacterium]
MPRRVTVALKDVTRSAARSRSRLRRVLVPGRPPGTTTSAVAVAPLWARAYRSYLEVRDHPGKPRVLHALHERGLRSRMPFACTMRNGAWLAIRPEEGLVVNESVGWTCFRERRWDPHVEACIR